jgi:hypothetical protein
VLAHSRDVPRCRLLEAGEALRGEDAVHATTVIDAALPLDEAALLHPPNGVGEPGAGVHDLGGKLGHPHRSARRLGELHEDLVLAEREVGVLLELAAEGVHQPNAGVEVGAPLNLLHVSQPASSHHGPG